MLYSAPVRTGTHFNAHSYENAILNQNLQSQLAAGLENLRLNDAALLKSQAQFDEGAVGSVSTIGSNSTVSRIWEGNTIDNAFYKAIHEQNNDYSFVFFFNYYVFNIINVVKHFKALCFYNKILNF